MREFIDAAVFKDIILCANAALEQNRQLINELNVFPVPDGDTGTNMSLTMGAAAAELSKKSFPTLGAAADCAASAMLRGARGNSGVILSLLFRGLAKRLKGAEKADAKLYAAAMSDGVDAAYKAVMKPAEGTILTVSRVSTSSAVEFAEHGSDLELMISCALESAGEALADTINLNPVLARAGVVDAGGKGYVFILEATLSVLRGEAYVPEVQPDKGGAFEVNEHADFAAFSPEEIEFAYDTVYIVRKNGEPLEPLRIYLESIGDSLVISEDDEVFKVHVHTNIPGHALTESQKYGELEVAKIENMRIQAEQVAAGQRPTTADDAENELEPGSAAPEKPFGAVAVCAGAGMAEIFRELGVDRIVTGGQTMNPSTEDILNEINRTPAETVFVFPNNKNIIMAAEQTVDLTEKKVVVVPSKTVPQGVSAMLVFDPDASEEDNLSAMTDAMAGVTTMQITYAARDSDIDGHNIHAGEYLALWGSSLFGSSADLKGLLRSMAEKVHEEGHEFVTVYAGADLPAGQAEETAALFREVCPECEVTLIDGGQPVYYYLISAE